MQLGDLFTIAKGKKPTDAFGMPGKDSVRLLQIEDLRPGAVVRYCCRRDSDVLCDTNDIVIAWDGAHAGIASAGLQGACGSTLARLRATSTKTYTPYIVRYLESQLANIRRNRTGATIPHVNPTHLRKIDIPLPPLPEQERIAKLLDAADTLRAKRRTSIIEIDKLMQATFLDLFGDPITNPMGWEVRPLTDLCERIVDCPHSTPVYSEEPTGYFCVRSSDIQQGSIDLTESRHVSRAVYEKRTLRYEPREGEVVYTREGGRLGLAGIVPPDRKICLGQRMMLFCGSPQIAHNSFIWGFLHCPSVRRKVVAMSGGGAAPRVNIRQLKELPAICPPLALQARFASVVNSVEHHRIRLTTHLAELDTLYACLLSHAFSGTHVGGLAAEVCPASA